MVESTIETVFDTFCTFMTPHICTQFINVMGDLQSKQDPPYSKGVLMVEVHRVFRKSHIWNATIFRDCAFNIFAELARKDFFYNDS